MTDPIRVQIQFSGILDTFVDDSDMEIELPSLKDYFAYSQREKWTLKDLLIYIKENLLKERPERFLQGDSVRHGILVLVNDVNWEMLGELNYELQNNDMITFLTTFPEG